VVSAQWRYSGLGELYKKIFNSEISMSLDQLGRAASPVPEVARCDAFKLLLTETYQKWCL
jgi:hypothetical protein